MAITNLAVLLIVLGCVAYQYAKKTFVRSFATIITLVCAAVPAFGYFEPLANVFVSRSADTRFPSIVPWAQPLSFALLFIVAFAILQIILAQLTKKTVDFGKLPEGIGRAVCGIFIGLITSGILFTFLAMAPLPNKYPYPRFDPDRPNAEKSKNVLFKVDRFATGWFSLLSRGSFSGKRSFAALHPTFIDQVFLNRHSIDDKISIITSSNAIELPRAKGKQKPAAAWLAPDGLKDSKGQPIPPKTGHSLTIVRVGFPKETIKEAGIFTISQLRLICKQKVYADKPLLGKARNVYPLGYLRENNQLQIKKLNDIVRLMLSDFDQNASVRWIDFAFYVPNDSVPTIVEFKLNGIAPVPPLVATQQAPPPVPFAQRSDR